MNILRRFVALYLLYIFCDCLMFFFLLQTPLQLRTPRQAVAAALGESPMNISPVKMRGMSAAEVSRTRDRLGLRQVGVGGHMKMVYSIVVAKKDIALFTKGYHRRQGLNRTPPSPHSGRS